MSYGNGIKLTAGFDVGAKTPLDSKSVVQTIAERDAFVTDNLVYEGLEVYVKDTGHKYRYNGTSWIDLDTQSGSESGTGEGLTTEQANQLTTAYEHSQTPHVSADDIPTNISDLTNDSGFITSSDLPTVPTKVSDLENDSGFITSIPSEYITETELETKGYLTEHQDISNLALKSEIPDVSSFITSDDLPTVPTKVSDLENDSNFVTNSKMLEAIANAQLGNGEDSDIDLSVYQPIEESTLTTTAKTIPTAINELKSGLDGIKVPINISELNNDSGYLTSHQDISNLQPKTDDSLTTTDKTVVGAINEISGTQLDTVSFSADYKNIILNRKSGLNPYTIPIASIINNTSLTELKDIDGTDIGNGKTIVYNSVTQKHKYVNATLTDELVKMDSTTEAHYLADLIDKSTIVNEDGILKVKMLDGQDVTIAEINNLKGLTMNIMDLVNSFANGGVKVLNTPVATYADLITLDRSAFIEGISYIVYVLTDETHAGAKTTYLCDKTSSTYFGTADSQRNFTTNPIDLANEVTGKLDNSHIDVDSLWTLLTIKDTYKTLTTKNEVFGTHGAKALYDELVTYIGEKANTSDLTTHTGDTGIHVTTTDKAKWNKVTDKLDTVDFNTHKNNTGIHITSDERIKWNKVDNKINKTDITTTINSSSTDDKVPSAKAVNIRIEEKLDKTTFYNSSLFKNGDVAGRITNANELPQGFTTAQNLINAPIPDLWMCYLTVFHNNDLNYVTQLAFVIHSSKIYIRSCSQRVWGSWMGICPITVEDVDVTTITPVNSAITGTIEYTVKNGICYVSMKNLMSTISSTGLVISTTMPKPSVSCNAVSVSSSGNIATIYIDKNTAKLNGDFYEKNVKSHCSFSYPVAEP